MAWLLLATAVPAAETAAELCGVPVLVRAPASPVELRVALQSCPGMSAFARDGEVIDNGLQTLVYGERLPLGPAPATPWAKPLPGRPLKLVFIGQTANCYDLAEVQRRLDCEVRFIHLPDQYYFGKTYPEALAGHYSAEAIKTLAADADAIVADPLVRLLSPEAARAIQQKVESGCGLVLFPVARWGGGGQFGYWPSTEQGGPWKDWLAKLVASAAPTRRLDQHVVVSTEGLWDGVPWPLLPAHWVADLAPAAAKVLAKDNGVSLAVGGTLGKGRVILLPWGTYMGGFPLAEDNKPAKVRDYQEYYASAVIRAVLWAADRSSPLRLMAEVDCKAGEDGRARIAIVGTPPAGTKIELRLRDLLCRDLWNETAAVAGPSLDVRLPPLPAGQHVLDIIARDPQGRSLGWSTVVVTVEAQVSLRIALDKEAYTPDQPATITAHVEGAGEGQYTARLRVWDALGRLLHEETKPLAAGRAEWTFANRDPLCVLHYADVEVQRAGRPYFAARSEFFSPRYTFDDFHNCLWGAWLPDYAIPRIDRRLREAAGFDIMLCGGYGGSHRTGNHAHLASGAVPFYTNVACVSPNEVELNPDRAKQEAVKSVDGCLPELKQFGAAVIFFQDERHGMADPGKLTPEALAAFRTWLKNRYKTIDELNAVWGRKFGSFDDVVPLLTEQFDPRNEASLAPWMEWRLWVMERVVDIDRTSARRIREHLGHDAWMGLEGIFGGDHNFPYGGLDLAAQGEDCLNAAAPYSETFMPACQSFYAGPSFSWNGYGNPYPVYQRYVWARALQGDWSLGWFCGNTFYSPYDAFLPQAQWVADLTRPLRHGVGKLLGELRPTQRDPVAFLYSQSSLYAMGILGKSVDPANPRLLNRPAEWARENLQRMFHDAGIEFGYLSEKQLQQGGGAGVRLLVLSSCVALEPATCAAVEKFVANGGVVLADLSPGVWDGRGGYHNPGQLDHLFGVRRSERFSLEALPADWNVNVTEAEADLPIQGAWLIGDYFERSLAVTDGRALGKLGFANVAPPALVHKRTGKGATILMNYLPSNRRRLPEYSERPLAAAMLRLAGVAAPVRLFDAEKQGMPIASGTRIVRWKDGPALYVGVLLEEGRNVRVELPQPGHLYELSGGGRYLGEGTAVSLDLKSAPHALLASLPYKIEGIDLRAGPGRRGQPLPLEWTLRGAAGTPLRHVVHFEVLRPDGTSDHNLSRNCVFRGQGKTALPLALNDPPGRWTIRGREVCSGVTAEAIVEVQP